MDSNDANAPDTPRAASLKNIASLALSALVVGAALYFVGLSQGQQKLRTQGAEHEARSASIQADLSAAHAKLERSRTRGELMQAQLALYRTVMELDRRNFGIASGHLQQAGATLKRAAGSDANAPIGRLATAISTLDVNVATNLQQQRAQVLTQAEALDALIAEQAEPADSSAQPAPK